ncbi:G1 family glutamic endopeptidase [Fodinicola feengrottensis]|uniref:G1 family endopeptidase n=1 Tax=Fodinicola feengrottensis TaxID=435914 RepID=A0ABN2G9T5_9ACTN|nr:G1 family glutamic endopeptidase [Fodinicola feengrottensis]
MFTVLARKTVIRRTAVVLLAVGIGLSPNAVSAATPTHYHGAAFVHGNNGNVFKRSEDSAWGGYAVSKGGQTIVASWVNPRVDCSGGGVNSAWDGFDGYGTQTVEQIGIDLDCSSGSAVYKPWYEMYPRDSVYFDQTTSEGDQMTATVTHDSGINYTLTLADSTQNWSRTFHDSLDGANDSTAEVIMERLSSNVDNFGSMTFSGCQLDGQPFGNSAPDAITIASNGVDQATPGNIDGDHFDMTWDHA